MQRGPHDETHAGSHDDPVVEEAATEAAQEAANDRRRIAELEDEIAELSATIDAATARLLVAIAEFDRRQGWADGFVSCAHWLSWRVGLTRGTAREKVRVARALTSLPCITTALARGQISYSKVREVTRVATPENEAELVQLCQAGTASQVQRIVRAYRRCERAELDTAGRQREGRYLSLRTDDDGMLVIEGRLPPEVGALLTRALEEAERELRRRAKSASAGARRAGSEVEDASAGARRAGSGTEDASAEAQVREPIDAPIDSPSQRRADALGLVAGRALGAGQSARGEPCQVVLHVDRAVLSGQQAEGGRCHLEHGPAVAAETARRLSCDAPVVTLIEDDQGQPLDVGRKTRRVSAALFRALRARDQTCQFPGCDRTIQLTPHHITHWAAGGATNGDNLCLLCALLPLARSRGRLRGARPGARCADLFHPGRDRAAGAPEPAAASGRSGGRAQGAARG